ncbi:hypothetical protein [Sediminibacillus albus]|uniref:Uncharacterized protein n=1 Tax=Sediminibacillus albus TaxID=407036 RepID=A0A1G8XGP8_9BACI|nr:hypothetical protein [Sediminibacillus albus]SDJ89768.1 hypothetical protein SAMN05216243_1356 [Sediminibacillus albus]
MKKKQDYKLSYESDGKMGKEMKRQTKDKTESKDEKMFFNTTQSSE